MSGPSARSDTEWNNGTPWAGHEPNYEEEVANREMIKMLDRVSFVERYAIHNRDNVPPLS